jgi:HNH endonuclease
MARRSRPNSQPELIRTELVQLLTNFADELNKSDLRLKVRSLVPAFHKLRDLGSSLIPLDEAANGRDRILAYFQKYLQEIIDGDELMVISGIGEWARRIRELRVELGWWIYSGVTLMDIAEAAKFAGDSAELNSLQAMHVRPDQYVLMSSEQDREAAFRWNVLNEIRRKPISVTDRILAYLRENVGKQITGEELKYLAKDKKEWARRVRELRTEAGWPIVTRNSGREDLPIGVYLLEEDRQAEEHDRNIPDPVRVAVLERDNYSCVQCGWNRSMLSPGDPRKFLELHHKIHHVRGGENTVENLVTLCNVDHDELHRKERLVMRM